MKLISLHKEMGKDVYQFLSEFPLVEEGFYSPFKERIPYEAFPAFLAKKCKEAEGLDLAPGYVPQQIYLLEVEGVLVGIGKLRAPLTQGLRKHGGHIGYGIHPSHRGKGYGKALLALLLEEAKKRMIPRVLLTCNENNGGSRGVIEANGGQLSACHEGQCNYWIPLVSLSRLTEDMISDITTAFADQGWHKPRSLYEAYIAQEQKGHIRTFVAYLGDLFLGYGYVSYQSSYPYFKEKKIPEIKDVNVLMKARGLGLGDMLMEAMEKETGLPIGLCVGLLKDYGPAQRLYVRRGYLPDGLGIHANDVPCGYQDRVIVDDDLVLGMIKE